ncbi:MAG: chitobiase/beta-hexosaminidase C-terminal domain-containing protein [Fusicatenibacter sp.]
MIDETLHDGGRSKKMKCSRCGATLENGKLFCPVCGQEVQLVPDYETVETVYYKQKAIKKEEQLRKENRRAAREEMERQESVRRKRLRKKRISLLVSLLVFLLLSGLLAMLLIAQKHQNSYTYQIEKAGEFLKNQEYERAQIYLERAEELEPGREEAYLMELQLLMENEKTERLTLRFNQLVECDPDNIAYYGAMISYFEERKEPERIKELLDECSSDTVRKNYAEYITEDPEFSLQDGSYNSIQTVTFLSDGTDEIYYTLDGTSPDRNSTRYQEGITLSEGDTLIKAIAYNEKNIPGNVVTASYHVTLKSPNPPSIYPRSGEYTTQSDTNLYIVVPEGCTAHYAFDRKATQDDPIYTGPVPMLMGEHSFYAVLVNENGKISSQGSIVYKLTET